MIEYTQTELRIMALCTVIGTTLSYLIGGFDKLLIALLVFIVIDYTTGLIAAWKTSELGSKKGFDGIKRKAIMLVVVVAANQIDQALGTDFRSMIIFAYIGNEGLSITENIDRMGYGEYIPCFIREKLAQLRNEKEGKNNAKSDIIRVKESRFTGQE